MAFRPRPRVESANYGDDFYNYLSYAQQAENGAFLFQNRVLLEEHPPALVNLEWWLVGRLSDAARQRPAPARVCRRPRHRLGPTAHGRDRAAEAAATRLGRGRRGIEGALLPNRAPENR